METPIFQLDGIGTHPSEGDPDHVLLATDQKFGVRVPVGAPLKTRGYDKYAIATKKSCQHYVSSKRRKPMIRMVFKSLSLSGRGLP